MTDWPEEDYGKFYNGDSYIILNTYKKEGSDVSCKRLILHVLVAEFHPKFWGGGLQTAVVAAHVGTQYNVASGPRWMKCTSINSCLSYESVWGQCLCRTVGWIVYDVEICCTQETIQDLLLYPLLFHYKKLKQQE